MNVTYPRFLRVPSAAHAAEDLIFELRVGRSGLGDDWLYAYTPGGNGKGGTWGQIGRYLKVRVTWLNRTGQACSEIVIGSEQ